MRVGVNGRDGGRRWSQVGFSWQCPIGDTAGTNETKTFWLVMTKIFPREVLQSSSLENLKTCLDKVLKYWVGSHRRLALSKTGLETSWGPFQPGWPHPGNNRLYEQATEVLKPPGSFTCDLFPSLGSKTSWSPAISNASHPVRRMGQNWGQAPPWGGFSQPWSHSGNSRIFLFLHITEQGWCSLSPLTWLKQPPTDSISFSFAYRC